jgi:hypothetical protein
LSERTKRTGPSTSAGVGELDGTLDLRANSDAFGGSARENVKLRRIDEGEGPARREDCGA